MQIQSIQTTEIGFNQSMRVVARMGPFRFVWLVFTVVGGAIFAVPSPAQHASLAPDTATIAEQYLLAAANQERQSRGLPALHRDAHLASAASHHAQEMAAHESPRTTKLYECTKERLTQDEVGRIRS